MAAAAFLGCFCTGHGCWPPRPGVTASPNVKVNGIPAHRMGDLWMVHCCPDDGCHPGVVASGAGNVHINGLQAARMGDSVACGSIIAMGSPNVDFGAPMSAMSMISGALGVAGSLGFEVPGISDVLGSLGVDVANIDVTGWVSENLFNGAVLPASILSLTEGVQNFIVNGSLMDLSEFTNTLLPSGSGIPGSINFEPLKLLSNATGIPISDVVGKLSDVGITVTSEQLSDALKIGLNVVQNGLNIKTINSVSDILGFPASNIGLPSLPNILNSYGVELSPAVLSDLTTQIDLAGANSPSLPGLISSYTGLGMKVSTNVADLVSNITLPYIESKLNSYISNVPQGLGTRAINDIMIQIKTKITIDIRDKTGSIILV